MVATMTIVVSSTVGIVDIMACDRADEEIISEFLGMPGDFFLSAFNELEYEESRKKA